MLFEKMNVLLILGLLFFVTNITGEMIDKSDDGHLVGKRAIKADCKGCVNLCLWKFHCEMCWKASCDQSGCTCKPVSGGCRLTNGCQNVVQRQRARTGAAPKRSTLS